MFPDQVPTGALLWREQQRPVWPVYAAAAAPLLHQGVVRISVAIGKSCINLVNTVIVIIHSSILTNTSLDLIIARLVTQHSSKVMLIIMPIPMTSMVTAVMMMMVMMMMTVWMLRLMQRTL